jgi:hypothetical protein
MAVGGLGRDCVAVMQTTESRQGDNLLSPHLTRYWITSGKGIKANAALGIKYHSVLGLLKCHAYFAGLP